jgi:hypothetical protein
MSYKKSPVCVKCYMYSHVGISPGIFLPFCMAVCYTHLLSLGMAVCDYASLVTLIQPIQNATFFGKNVPKIIFAIMGGSKYFSDLFRPQFLEHVVQFQHSGGPSEYCLCSKCIIQKWAMEMGG